MYMNCKNTIMKKQAVYSSKRTKRSEKWSAGARTENPFLAHARFEALDEPAARAELARLRVDAAVPVEVALELHRTARAALTTLVLYYCARASVLTYSLLANMQ